MIVDLAILDDYVERGLLRKAEDEDLVQYNYSEKTNNEGLWDDITMFNRGNIYEKKTGLLIAKSMPKFLNLGQLPEQKQKELSLKSKYNLTEKMDGCLGILYEYKGEVRCNSRGGFNNYVTDKIKELIPKYLMLKRILEHNTLNVEVISPETKIICDYGNIQELYLITAFCRDLDWQEYSPSQLEFISQVMKMPRVKETHMSWDALLKWQRTANWEKEGYVIRFENNERVKIKSEDYLKIAKIRANLCKHTLWKLWKNDLEQNTESLKPYLENVPDELAKTAKKYMSELNEEMEKHRQNALTLSKELENIETRDLSKYFKDNPSPYQYCLYQIRNNKSFDRLLIKLIEPEPGFEETVKLLEEV